MSAPIFFSVIIPTCHRNDMLADCLACIRTGDQQGLDVKFEVLVSDDGVKTTAKEMLAAKYSWVRWLEGPHRGPAANRNQGAKLAAGDWLVFVDDDCLPEKNWLQALAHQAQVGQFSVLEGKTIAVDRQDNPLKYYVENLHGGSFWSCNLAVRREVFWRLGGFDEDFLEAGGEDMEFAYRIKSSQLSTSFVTDAVVVHPSRDVTMQSLIWRTFLIRWMLLYKLKTGQGVPLESSSLKAAVSILVQSVIDLLRTTWHLISKCDSRRWRTQVFDQSWKWLTFPIVLPYLIYWELRFRKQMISAK